MTQTAGKGVAGAIGALLVAVLIGSTAGASTARSTTIEFKANAIAVGSYDTCAITPSGGAKCWGDNDFAALGRGDYTRTDSLTPVQVVGLRSGVTSISAGLWAACAIVTGGNVKCWGSSLRGGRNRDSAKAVPVPGLGPGIRAVAVGDSSCALTRVGGVKCWGLGPKVHTVFGLRSGVTAISVGGGRGFACVVTVAGSAKCWGDNHFGELGDGTTRNSARPVNVAGLRGVVAVAAGEFHACALTRGGAVKCWGANDHGDLGNRGKKQSSRPVSVVGLGSGVSAIAAGDSHTCALLRVGTVKCWGEAQANGRESDSAVPAGVSKLGTNAVAIGAGGPTSCALLRSGGVRCWGYNGSGELGNGTRRSSTRPVVVRARPPRIIPSKLIVGTGSITLPAQVNGLSADGTRVAVRQVRGTYDRPCVQVLVWTPSRKAVARFHEKCTTARADHYLDLTVAGSRLLWADYSYGNFAYCSGPFMALLPSTRPKQLGLCNGEDSNVFLETAGAGGLAVVSRYDYCEDSMCTDQDGNPLPQGDYNVAVYRVSGSKLVRVLKPVDNRTLLGVAAGRILVQEPDHRVVLYDASGVQRTTVDVHADQVQAVLTNDTLAIKDGSTLNVYVASTGVFQRTQAIAAGAKLRDAQAGIALYTRAGTIHLLRLSDGRDVAFRKVSGLVGTQIEAGGLIYAYNAKGRGHAVLVPFSRLTKSFGSADERT